MLWSIYWYCVTEISQYWLLQFQPCFPPYHIIQNFICFISDFSGTILFVKKSLHFSCESYQFCSWSAKQDMLCFQNGFGRPQDFKDCWASILIEPQHEQLWCSGLPTSILWITISYNYLVANMSTIKLLCYGCALCAFTIYSLRVWLPSQTDLLSQWSRF